MLIPVTTKATMSVTASGTPVYQRQTALRFVPHAMAAAKRTITAPTTVFTG